MRYFDLAGRAIQTIAAALMLGLLGSAAVRAETPVPPCDVALDTARLEDPLARSLQKLNAGQPLVIVAIGSSSTAGAGASSPAASYPSRLEAELRAQYPKSSITVLNRGVNGEETAEMLKRFDSAVIANKPDLVLWQVGTNAVLRDQKISDNGASIREGLAKIRSIGADVVLIDPQYVPKVLAKPEVENMVAMIAATAKQENVDLFRRFEVMKRWSLVDHQSFDTFVSADGLHLNDWGYACMAKGLSLAIVDALRRPVQSATAMPHLLP